MALRLLHWVHMRWQHDGLNEPTRRDALTILREARDGKNFRCVEYAIVNKRFLVDDERDGTVVPVAKAEPAMSNGVAA